MSLLRNVLRKNSASSTDAPSGLSPKSRESLLSMTLKKSADAISIKSAGGLSVQSVRSIAESITSFTSQLLGGQRVPKRRRPDISRLGAPTWYNKDPPEPSQVPGSEEIDFSNEPYTAAHAYAWKTFSAGEDMPPYCSMVLYNYADPSAAFPKYHSGTKIRGELRLRLSGADSITSIDIWCIGRAESVFSVGANPHVNYHASLWSRISKEASKTTKHKLPVDQTIIFPFEIPAFRNDVKVQKQDSTNVTRIPMPPTFKFTEVGAFSGQIKYYIGVNINRAGMITFDDEWKVPFFYFPLHRPIPREPTNFPYISDREDWPFKREAIGGWTITPFGARGRFKDEIVEIEGLFGVQTPEVYSPGQTVRWSMLLWSKNIPALEAITDPKSDYIDVVLLRSTVFGRDVLQPKNAARKNRHLQRISQGRVWRTDDGPPADDIMPALRGPPKTSGWNARGSPSTDLKEEETKAAPKSPLSPTRRSRFQEVIVAEEMEDEGQDEMTIAEEGADGEKTSRSPSPAPSLEDDLPDFPDIVPEDATVRLDGDVRIPAGLGPSFRYEWMGREYVLFVLFTHPDYLHISPSATGIYAETPIWLVTGDPKSANNTQPTPMDPQEVESQSYLSKLPIVGDTIDLGTDPIRMDLVTAKHTNDERPTLEAKRMATF